MTKEYQTSRSLGKTVDFPFLSGHLLLPFGGITIVVGLVSRFVGFPLNKTIAVIIWLCVTWWMLAGSKNWLFIAKILRLRNRKVRKIRRDYKPLITTLGGDKTER